MRLTSQQIKQAIIHPERIVRDVALRYFSESYSEDPTIMPRTVQAIETYGWDDAFEYHHFLDSLVQTEDTLLWLIDRLNRMGRPRTEPERHICHRLSSVICESDVALLMKHEQAILGLEGFFAECGEVMADRLRLMTVDAETCWQDLERLCQEHRSAADISKFPTLRAFRMCEAIARDGGHAEQVLSILGQKIQEADDNPLAWLECFVVRLAGEMRLEAALPMLVEKLKADGGDLLNEECQRSLAKIGTDAAVEAICRDFASAPWHYRLYAAGSLSYIRSDLVVAKCLELLGHERSGDLIEADLILATLANFSDEGIERARQFTLTGNHEVRTELLAAATLLGVSFPELERWKAQQKQDAVERKRRAEWLSAPLPKPQRKPPPPITQNVVAPPVVSPITRKEKVGRNDPCPCGSGKKFKKCCMGKE